MDTIEQQAFALFDRGKLDDGEEAWSKAREAEAKLHETLGLAGREVELAIMLDPGYGEARSLLADVLLQRALLAEKRCDTRPKMSSWCVFSSTMREELE